MKSNELHLYEENTTMTCYWDYKFYIIYLVSSNQKKYLDVCRNQ